MIYVVLQNDQKVIPNCPRWRRIWFMCGLIHSSAWQDFFHLSTEAPKTEMFYTSGPLQASSLSLQPSLEHVLIIRMSCCTPRERCQRQQGRAGGSLRVTEPPHVTCCGLAFTLWVFLTQDYLVTIYEVLFFSEIKRTSSRLFQSAALLGRSLGGDFSKQMTCAGMEKTVTQGQVSCERRCGIYRIVHSF